MTTGIIAEKADNLLNASTNQNELNELFPKGCVYSSRKFLGIVNKQQFNSRTKMVQITDLALKCNELNLSHPRGERAAARYLSRTHMNLTWSTLMFKFKEFQG